MQFHYLKRQGENSQFMATMDVSVNSYFTKYTHIIQSTLNISDRDCWVVITVFQYLHVYINVKEFANISK
jgi:hypothetical protein